MKKLAILTAAIFVASLCKAQGSFSSTSKLFSVGAGAGTPFFGSGYKHTLPVNPTVNFEKGITGNVSVGGSVTYAGSKYELYEFKIKYHAFLIGARAAWHFLPAHEKLDAYAGAGLGYVIVSVRTHTGDHAAASSGVGYMAFAGGRYYFTRSAALYVELGYSSLSLLNAGISVRF